MEKLFHYTSINNLALILESKKIRFTRLDCVNDPNEGKSSDFKSMAVYLFISSWTKNQEENFALWNMYTNNMRGVRIEFPIPLFNSYNIGDESNYFVSEEEYLDEVNGLFIVSADNKPIVIDYTNDDDKLSPKIKTEIGLKTSSLGIAKKTIWKIEDEVRYKMEIYPYNPNENLQSSYEEAISKKSPPSINFYDVNINEEAFKKMEIIIGPKMKVGDRQIIESLVANYNPTARIQESKLSGDIK